MTMKVPAKNSAPEMSSDVRRPCESTSGPAAKVLRRAPRRSAALSEDFSEAVKAGKERAKEGSSNNPEN